MISSSSLKCSCSTPRIEGCDAVPPSVTRNTPQPTVATHSVSGEVSYRACMYLSGAGVRSVRMRRSSYE